MRSRTWLWAGLLTLSGASCVAILDGEHPYKQGETTFTGAPCSTTANCDDDNPCTTDSCPTATLVCEYAIRADGAAPATSQIPADCKRIRCVAGQPITEDDPQDLVNDNNSCTMDVCSAGIPTNQVLPDDSSCTQGDKMGTCVGGVCEVACSTNTQCDDKNPCSEEFCNTSTSRCSYNNLDGVPTPGVIQTPGDCKVQWCENGVDKSLNDDADVVNDGNPCTTDLCMAGMPSNPTVAERTLCVVGETKVCTSAGQCVECVVAADCVNIVETECEKRSCVNNKCQIAYQGTDTLASPVLQKPGDCKKVVCNGDVGPTSVNDDTDAPDDGNPCTKNVCTNGMPSNPPEAQNLNCGGTQVCDGMGKCVGCTIAAQCPGMDDFCKSRTCTNGTCGYSFTANGTDLPMGQTSGDCKVLECDGAGNVKTSVLTSDLPVDGNPCTNDTCSMNGSPSNPASPINSACNVGGGDVCDGNGNCKKSSGNMCATSTECLSTFCIDGVCCGSACVGTCKSCAVPGMVGTCSNTSAGTDPDNECADQGAMTCGTNGVCDGSGACQRYPAGTICAPSSCSGSTQTNADTCSGMGSCVDRGTLACSPYVCGATACKMSCAADSDCVTGAYCQMNACVAKKALGQACSSGNQCNSGNCVDFVCCNSASCAVCQSCGNGACATLLQGQQDTFPAGTCDGTKACNGGAGAGACLLADGQPCSNALECAGGYCMGNPKVCVSP